MEVSTVTDVTPIPAHTRLVRTPHPLTTQGQTSVAVLQQDGETLLSVLQRHDVDSTWVVEVGGLQVPAIMWARVRVHHGQVIECRAAVHKEVVKIIAFAALAYFTMGAGAGWIGTTFKVGAFGAAMIGAVAFAAGAMVINRILPPPKAPSMDLASNTVEPTYSLSGGRNSARLWQPMGLVLGQPYAVFDLAAQPFTYFGGEDQYMQQIFHLGINCQRVDTLRIGQTALSSFEGVSIAATGLPGNSYSTSLPSNNVDTIPGGLLDAPTGSGPWVTRTTSVGASQIAVDVEANLYGTNATNGAWQEAQCVVELQYAVAGSGVWASFSGGSVTLANSSAKPLRRTFIAQVPAGQYDVRLRKITANNTSTTGQNAVNWVQLRSFQAQTASFPGQSILALNIKASGQLSGAVDELNGILTAKPCDHWTGSAWVTATDRSNGLSNPGSIMLAYARGFYDSSGRLMAGLGWPDSRIDLDSIKGFTLWCTQRGFTFDAFIQDAMSHGDVLDAIAYAGMGSTAMPDGKLGVQWLADDAPVEGVINMGNIKAKSFSVQYDTNDRADEIEYGYFDRNQGNQWNALRVLAPGVTMPRSTARLSNMGITSEAHAAVLARHSMAQNIYMAKAITFEQDLEHLTYKRGTVLALSHDMTQWGYSGRVQSVTDVGGVITLGLDDAVPATGPGGASNKFIGLRLLGEAQYRIFQVQAFTGSARSVTLVGAWPSGVPLPGTSGQVHDALWVFDFKATPGLKVVVSKVEPTAGMTGARVTVVPLPNEFWPFVNSGAYTPPPNRSLLNVVPSVSGLAVYEVLRRQGNTWRVDLSVTFDAGPATSSVQVWGAQGNAPLVLMGTTLGRSFDWAGSLGEVWALELRPFNALGRTGTPQRIGYTVQGLSVPPSNVAGLGVAVESNGLRVSWAPCPDVDYAETIIKVGASWATATVVAKKTASSHLLPFAATGALTVWAAHVDTSGNPSTTPTSATLTIAPPSPPASLQLGFGTASIEAKWTEPVPSSTQQPIERIELSWGPSFTTVVDGKRATTTTFGWLPAGVHTLYARYVDAAGNVGSASQATLQVLAPAQPVMTAVETQINAVTLRWQDAKTSQPIRKYAIYYGDAGTTLASAMLYGSAGADSRSDILFYRSSGDKVAYLVAEDVAGNVGVERLINVNITMPNDFVLASEYYEDWQSSEVVNGTIIGGSAGQIILPSFSGRTWGQRLSNNGWTTAQQKVDAGFPIVAQPVPASGKHVEQRDLGKVLATAVIRATPSLQSSVAGYVATVRIRASVGASTTTWQPWLVGESATFSDFRYIEVEYGVTSDGKGFVVLDDLYVKVEITEVTESTTLALNAADAAGTAYVCTKTFQDLRGAVATPLGSANIARINCIVDDATLPARVYVQAWDTNNNRTSGTVSLYLSGV